MSMTMSESFVRESHKLRWTIGINAFIVLFASILLYLFLQEVMFHVDPGCRTYAFGLCFGGTIFAWGWIFPDFIGRFFVNVRQNCEVILSSEVTHDKIPEKISDRLKMFDRASMRPIGQGLRAKGFFEDVIGAVSLVPRVFPLRGKDNPLTCYTAENLEVEIEGIMKVAAIPGLTPNAYRSDPEVAVRVFRGKYERATQKLVASQSDRVTLAMSEKDVDKDFKDVLDGEDVGETEQSYGLAVVSFQITAVRRSPDAQKISQMITEFEKMAKGIGLLDAGFSEDRKPDSNTLLAIASQRFGKSKSNLVLIPGIAEILNRVGKGDITTLKSANPT